MICLFELPVSLFSRLRSLGRVRPLAQGLAGAARHQAEASGLADGARAVTGDADPRYFYTQRTDLDPDAWIPGHA